MPVRKCTYSTDQGSTPIITIILRRRERGRERRLIVNIFPRSWLLMNTETCFPTEIIHASMERYVGRILQRCWQIWWWFILGPVARKPDLLHGEDDVMEVWRNMALQDSKPSKPYSCQALQRTHKQETVMAFSLYISCNAGELKLQ